ncbi:MAG: recombinase family protein [Sphingomonadales bacterium]|nr:recombinase family protein [Sphingomonadales bacterium]
MRCAVYTRKSTEDGLEQEFNSLDAQYEACAAYALSQRHEGWVLNPERYDDGGFSGGNLERPGLKHLLADIETGKIDIVLLYKIDRLTRSLTDFSKIVEVLDTANASFVSITQSFNTTTSMGRLTLNMLLSLAQFEREVTGERIRDKIAASKRKGMWMGGPVPLGYEVENRKLVGNKSEAKLVLHIMQRYLALGSVVELAEELNRDGYRTKVQRRTSGPHRGGCIFRRGTLYHLLSNRIYRGMIVHKGEAFEGEHEAIVPQELWEKVQQVLAKRASGSARRLGAANPSLLTGMVTDGEGRSMTPSHATRPGKRYRYYVTRSDELEGSPAWRVSAYDLEKLVCEQLALLLCDQCAITTMLIDGEDPQLIQNTIKAAELAAVTLRSRSSHAKPELLQGIAAKITLRTDAVELVASPCSLGRMLGIPEKQIQAKEPIHLTCPATKVRRGHQLRLIIPGSNSSASAPRNRDEKLVALIAEAHTARKLLLANPGSSISAIAADAGKCRTRLSKLVSVACLAPDIFSAIVEGRQPAGLNAKTLLAAKIPQDWTDQRVALGFN